MGRLSGKVAIVTGGAQGQGAAIVRGFVAEGAKVVIADIATDEGELLVKEVGGDVVFVRHDVTSEADWVATVTTTKERFGRVDVLINNAGILLFSELTATSLEDYEKVIRINQFGTFLGMRSVVAAMEEAGGGSIVNASSIEGLGGMPFLVAYTSSKFAIRGMTKAAAMELGPKNIRVNSVHPGMIDTGMTRIHGGDAAMEWGGQRVALKRVGQPEDVVGMYVFLASDESSFCTGAEYVVDGGATATHAFGG